MLTAEEARELLDSIPLARDTARRRQRDHQPESQEPALVGLRDRTLIAVMEYSFARINAALDMKVRDYFVQGRRDGAVRLTLALARMVGSLRLGCFWVPKSAGSGSALMNFGPAADLERFLQTPDAPPLLLRRSDRLRAAGARCIFSANEDVRIYVYSMLSHAISVLSPACRIGRLAPYRQRAYQRNAGGLGGANTIRGGEPDWSARLIAGISPIISTLECPCQQ